MADWPTMLDQPNPTTPEEYRALAARQDTRAAECDAEGWKNAADSYRRLARINRAEAAKLEAPDTRAA